jgi:hypothetical protein
MLLKECTILIDYEPGTQFALSTPAYSLPTNGCCSLGQGVVLACADANTKMILRTSMEIHAMAWHTDLQDAVFRQ